MGVHREMAMTKFEDFKKYFGESIDLVTDSIDSFQVLIQKNGFNLEEKIHAKNMTRVKKNVLEILQRNFNSFKEDLRIYHAEGVKEFELRIKSSLEKVDKDISDLNKF
jgi:hypothetical protein